MKFENTDRVTLNTFGKTQCFLRLQKHGVVIKGTVICYQRSKPSMVLIKLDHNNDVAAFHENFWEKLKE
jgi:hypothetical protein